MLTKVLKRKYAVCALGTNYSVIGYQRITEPVCYIYRCSSRKWLELNEDLLLDDTGSPLQVKLTYCINDIYLVLEKQIGEHY